MDNTVDLTQQYIDSIDRHVPIPSPQINKAYWKKVVDAMQIGDSIMFPAKNEANNFAASLRNYGFKSVMRTQKSGAIRVWKMEPRDK